MVLVAVVWEDEAGEDHGKGEGKDIRHGPQRQGSLGSRHALFRLPAAGKEVVSVLARTVEEVVLDVASDRVDAVLDGTLGGALARSGEVGLEGACTRVGSRHSIGVVSPDCEWQKRGREVSTGRTFAAVVLSEAASLTISEQIHELLALLDPLVRAQNTRLPQLIG